MEFDELDESRRVAALTEAASRRAKEKQRARKKAKLVGESGGTNGVSSAGGTNTDGTGNLGIGISASASSTDGGGFPDDVSIDSQTRSMANHHSPQPDNQVSMTTTQPQAPPSSSSIVGADITSASSAAASPTQTIGGISTELRTGRWTVEETHYCDTLVAKFMAGRLPLPDGIKLNEFLSGMLKSKQSRLTKKMKNAKLSSKTFRRTTGYLTSEIEAREYSEAEDAFFHSLQNQVERSEMRFHTRKEWRETFSTYCVSHGQMLNADAWLESIDEMDRRVHRAKDRMRMERRKMMMGHALRHDSTNPNRGVVIDKANDGPGGVNGGSGATSSSSYNNGGGASSYSMTGGVGDPYQQQFQHEQEQQRARARSLSFALPDGVGQAMTSPFLSRIINYIHRNNIPFEYVDAWVPSFVPDGESGDDTGSQEGGGGGGGESVASGQQSSNSNANGEQKQSKCRLCFAGSIVAKQVIVGGEGTNQYRRAVPLTPDDQFNLAAFGDYSESFSFDVGCGLPGRVYHMGVPTWEQSVHNAPLHHFERVGGSQQWGIRTVVGIPVPSPNVGRVVIILYSRHDRQKDHDMVIRLTEEFTRLMPSPKWKLVVDVGQQPPPQQQAFPQQEQQQQVGGAEGQPSSEDSAALSSEVISIFGEHMPSDPKSPSFAYLQGFMSLRLLLLRQNRTVQEQDLVNTMLSSYSSYKAGGRTPADIALMLARDFMFLSQQQQQTVAPSPTNDLFSQPMQQQPPVQNGMHLSASPPNGTSSMPPPSPHLPPKQEEQLTFTFQVDKGTGESGGISIVTGDSSGMLGDVAPTPISEMISAAAAAAVSAASIDGGLGLVDPSVASTMQ